MRRPSLALSILTAALMACSQRVQVFEPRTGTDGGPLPVRDAAPDDGDLPSDDASTEPDAAVGRTGLHVYAGLDHSCAIRDGEAYCWGENRAGQLGLGHRDPVTKPTRVGQESDWVELCGGEEHSCGLNASGALFCWGKNLHGELGLGDFEPRLLPSRVTAPGFVRIACGGYNTCAIESNGTLWCWGDNFEGKLGLNDAFGAEDGTLPSKVGGGLSFRQVSIGQGSVAGVTREGQLYCWGRNTDSQCGTAEDQGQLRAPTQVGTDSDYRHVAAGQRYGCAIKVDGRLFCWGTDSTGSLGLGVADETRIAEPMQVGKEADYLDVKVQWFHACARRENGTLLCWGRNAEGQLGVGDIVNRNLPERVGIATDWSEVSVSHFHTCGVRSDQLYCWGINGPAQELGLGDSERRNTPALVSF